MPAERSDWAVKHTLDRIQVTIRLDQEGLESATVVGTSTTKRQPLWVEAEDFAHDRRGLELHDWVGHVILTALQDRPRNRESLQRGLGGGGFEDVPLPLW